MSAEDNKSLAPRSPSRFALTMQRFITSTHTFLYRLTGGSFGGRMLNAPVLLLITTGRKTGKRRTTPLLYLADGDNMVLVASNGGAARHPTWWLNLKSNSAAEVQLKRQIVPVTAEQADPEEKRRLWPLLVNMYSGYADYQKRTEREIPVVILRPDNR